MEGKSTHTGRFVVSEPIRGEKVVFDTKTKLMWQGSHAMAKTWEEAKHYSKSLKDGGYSNWRLPTVEELEGLTDKSLKDPASDFPGMPSTWFWSSSSYATNNNKAWYVYFANGNVSNYSKIGSLDVRCVR